MYNTQAEITKQVINSLSDKLEELFIDGLKLKGFEFENKIELVSFIKERCRCEDNIDVKQKTYFIDNIPFFLHDYNIIQEPFNPADPFTIKVNYGSFAYL